MLKRTLSAAFLNGIANGPDVRPSIGGSGVIDLAPLIANPANVTLECEYGGFVGVNHGNGIYECHSLFPTESRGAPALNAMREGLRYLFVETDCMEVLTKAPESNRAAFGAARGMGFMVMHRVEHGWIGEDGTVGPVDIMSLPLLKWMQRDDKCEARGKWFHQRLEELTEAAGQAIAEHPEESSHNKAVGAAILMLEAGNVLKGVGAYNLWAMSSSGLAGGFERIRLLSITPPIIDMHQVVLAARDGDMELLLCR